MAIRQKQYCDICEHLKGEESSDALIEKPSSCPAFPQLIWTYYKQGYQILKDHSDKKHLQVSWLGQVNRLEFCYHHADKFNALLKAFAKNDNRLQKVVDDIYEEDKKNWALRNKKIEEDYRRDNANRNGEHSSGSDSD